MAEAGDGVCLSVSFVSFSDSDPFCDLRNDCKVCCKYTYFYSNNIIGRNYIKALRRSAVTSKIDYLAWYVPGHYS